MAWFRLRHLPAEYQEAVELACQRQDAVTATLCAYDRPAVVEAFLHHCDPAIAEIASVWWRIYWSGNGCKI
jgi:hypothetical protein